MRLNRVPGEALQIEELTVAGFERVIRIIEPDAGLEAYIALHSLALGPALGGCRMFAYRSGAAALADACALAEGMSYKNALAGIPFGGGKSVIVGDPAAKTPELLAAFAAAVNTLRGDYLSAEDSGVAAADMAFMAQHSDFFAGADATNGGGNPAPYTARGVFLGLQLAARWRLGGQLLAGLKVGIEGLGQVGFELARLLRDVGARVYGTDLSPIRVHLAREQLGVIPVAPAELFKAPLDVFAPCALGSAITLARLRQLRAPVIAGAANNQLATPALGDLLRRRGQLYAPDYVINAAGVVSIGAEYLGCWSPQWVNAKIDAIPVTLEAIFEQAQASNCATSRVADRRARALLRGAQASTQGVAEAS